MAFLSNNLDQIRISEGVTALIPQMFISVSDSINISENTISIPPTTDLVITVSDSLSISESVTEVVPILNINTASVIYCQDWQFNQNRYDATVYNCYGGTASSGELAQQQAQSFVATGSYLKTFFALVYKWGTPTDNLILKITSSLGGTALVTGTKALSSVAAGASYVGFSIGGQGQKLIPGNTYYIEMSRDGVRDNTNRPSWYGSSTSGDTYLPGAWFQRNNTSWVAGGAYDLAFLLYYNDNPIVTPPADFLISVSDSINISDVPSPAAPEQILPISVSDSIYVIDSTLNQTQYDNPPLAIVYGGVAGSGEDQQQVAQSFVATGTALKYFTISITKTGLPTDDIHYKLTSSLDGTSIIDGWINGTLITPGFYYTTSLVVSNPIIGSPLVDGNTYYITFYRSGARDTANYFNIRGTNPVSSGGKGNVYNYGTAYVENNASWVEDLPNTDIYFGLDYGSNPSVTPPAEFLVSVFDSVNISENISNSISTSNINIFDSLNISENVSELLFSNINTFDTVNISENITKTSPSLSVPNVYDSINISENISRSISASNINIFDTVNLSESETLTSPQLNINIFDTINISESVSKLLSSDINKFDTLNISENITVTPLSLATISVFDTLNITESLFISQGLAKSDNINISESVTVSSPALVGIQVFDTLNISENIKDEGFLRISIFDTVNASENISKLVQLGDINKFETLNLSEGWAPDVIDSYNESHQNTSHNLYVGTNTYRGQSFTNINQTTLDSCKFYLSKTGSPIGTAIAQIYAHSGAYGVNGKPVDLSTPLAVSDPIDVTKLSGSFSLKLFNFSGTNRITFTPNTYYCVVLNYPTGDSNNYISIGEDGNVPSASGNRCYSVAGDYWSSDNVLDAIFYVYGAGSQVSLPYLGDINKFDTLNISENIKSEGVSYLNIFDSINISDVPTITTNLGDIVKYDLVNISENLQLFSSLGDISKIDQVNISESVIGSNPSLGGINVIDTLNILENFTDIEQLGDIKITDSINISEQTRVEIILNVNSTELITIMSNVTLESFRFSPSPGGSQPSAALFSMRPIASSEAISLEGKLDSSMKEQPVGSSGWGGSPVATKGISM